MRNKSRKTAFVMALVIVLSSISYSGIASLFATKSYAASVGDVIQFGVYPQSLVTEKSTLSKLNSAHVSWFSYKYYSGTGLWDDGKMTPGDFNQYCDVALNGEKYRGVRINGYRPYYSGIKSTKDNSYQDENGYYSVGVYWFKYEPLNWILLDPKTNLVISESVIDSQPFNNFIYYSNGEYYGNAKKSYYASDYSNSFVRSWLNDDFFNSAFGDFQKKNIAESAVSNPANSIVNSQYASPTTYDKIFLLSDKEIKSNSIAKAYGSDYAECQGLFIDSGNSPLWWLRTACNSSSVCGATASGTVSNGVYARNTYYGIRPVCRLYSLNLVPETEPSETTEPTTEPETEPITEPDTTDMPETEPSTQPQEETTTTEESVCVNHKFTEFIAPEFLRFPADCNEPASYYMSCIYCNEKSDEFFYVGLPTEHDYVKSVNKATVTQNGSRLYICKICKKTKSSTIYRPYKYSLSESSYVCNGKGRKPSLVITDKKGNVISDKYYDLSYYDNVYPGKGKIKVDFKGNYSGSKTVSFTITLGNITFTKQSNPAGSYKITMKWKSVAGADKYEIRYYNFSEKKWYTLQTQEKNQYVNTWQGWNTVKLRVRAVNTQGTKPVYGAWSEIVTFKHSEK